MNLKMAEAGVESFSPASGNRASFDEGLAAAAIAGKHARFELRSYWAHESERESLTCNPLPMSKIADCALSQAWVRDFALRVVPVRVTQESQEPSPLKLMR